VTIRKKGYPFRLLHQTFYRKFWPLVKQGLPYRVNDARAACQQLIQALAKLPGLSSANDVRLGKTMVFWRSAQDKPLAAMKALIMDRCARSVQKLIRLFLLKCLLFHLRRIKPILLNALKSDDLQVVEAALAESSKIRFQLREHALLEEKRFVIIETARVKKEVERLATMTVEDIDDEFEAIVASAKKLNINTPAAQRCMAMYQEVEDKRRVIAALRDIVKAATIELSEVEAVLGEVDRLKPKYGNNFCREEETRAREVLEIVRKEHFLVENIVQQIASGSVMKGPDARDPAMLMDLIEVRTRLRWFWSGGTVPCTVPIVDNPSNS
jgi:myosin heavy subunit